MNVDLFHRLEGRNIYFKPLSLSDVQEIHDYASDENVSCFIGWNLMHTLNDIDSCIISKMLDKGNNLIKHF